jgi:hypothetical protein
MRERKPYLEALVLAAAIAFLALIVVGGVTPRGDSPGRVTMIR